MSGQKIMTLTEFADKLVSNEDRPEVEYLYVYFFTDKVLTKQFKKADQYYVQPCYAASVKPGANTHTNFKLVDLKKRFGDDFGIRFDANKSRKLIKTHILNYIRYHIDEPSEYRGHKYYPTFSHSVDPDARPTNKLIEILHPITDVFKLSTKSKDSTQQDKDLSIIFGDEDCV
jgi:hypothetical protein